MQLNSSEIAEGPCEVFANPTTEDAVIVRTVPLQAKLPIGVFAGHALEKDCIPKATYAAEGFTIVKKPFIASLVGVVGPVQSSEGTEIKSGRGRPKGQKNPKGHKAGRPKRT